MSKYVKTDFNVMKGKKIEIMYYFIFYICKGRSCA